MATPLKKALTTPLLYFFFLVNTSALVLRRDDTTRDHFRTPTVVPLLGAASCVLLATQIEREVWLRGGIVLVVGAVAGAVTAVRRRP
ncbi:hypothetical protein [Streptomyces sp. NPDC048436]|uniref:hypothetical protein n=1 Tax=Streptomyces sp. NPDC048436 TaxID=3365550 RepID=UPI00371703E3